MTAQVGGLVSRGRGRPAIGARIELRLPAELLAELDAERELIHASRAEAARRILHAYFEARRFAGWEVGTPVDRGAETGT